MSLQWNEQQQQVIDFQKGNLLVAAAAGSGKTAVLTEHVLKKITSSTVPVDIDRLLIMTFTNAAAVEMKERIRGAIHERLQNSQDSGEIACLRRQINLLPHASISTVHSFCLSVIKEYFYRLDLEPGFHVGDTVELSLMLSDTVDEILEKRYGSLREEETAKQQVEDVHMSCGHGTVDNFRRLVLLFADKNNDDLNGIIRKIYEYSQAYAKPEKWIAECRQFYTGSCPEVLDGLIPLLYEREWGKLELAYQKARSLQNKVELQYPQSPNLDMLDYQVETLEAARKQEDFRKSIRILQENPMGQIRMKKKGEEPDCYALISEEKEGYVKLVNQLKKVRVLHKEMLLDELQRQQPLVNALLDMVEEAGICYEKKKREKHLLDYNDLEHMALRLLDDEAVAESYRERFAEILVDEYQDSSDVQEALIEKIAQNNVFMVGDVKQSIYGFRQAKPQLFLDKYASYSREAGAESRLIELNSNYRSRSVLLESINFIFYQIMQPQFGGITYDQESALHPAAAYPGEERMLRYPVELHLVTETDISVDDVHMSVGHGTMDDVHMSVGHGTMDETEDQEPVKELEQSQREIHIVGRRIQELLKEGKVYDLKTGLYRPVEYRDIAILSRSVQTVSQDYIRILQDCYDIPCYSSVGAAYFDTMEISDLLSFLKIIDNPLQDIPLAAVLVSPMFGFTPEELAQIKLYRQETGNSFYTQLVWFADNAPDSSLKTKTAGFCKCFQDIRNKSPYMSLPELLEYMMVKTNYRSYISAMPGSAGRTVNINMLIQKAKDYEQTSYHGVFQFLRYIEKLQEKEISMETPSASNEADNVVRLMTIHKSKGLEFPVVFLTGFGKKLLHEKSTYKTEFHESYGIAFDHVHLAPRYTIPSMLKRIFQVTRQRNELFEELRVLYVAMTRAKERLIMVGTQKELLHDIPTSVCFESSEFYQCKSYCDWVLRAIGRHPSQGHFTWEELGIQDTPNSCYVVTVHESAEIDRWQAEEQQKAIEEQQKSVGEEQQAKIGQKGTALNSDEKEQASMLKQLEEQFAYRYPLADYTQQKAIVSVSELKHAAMEQQLEEEQGIILQPDENILPALEKDKEKAEGSDSRQNAGARRGTVYHTVMEQLDFAEAWKACRDGQNGQNGQAYFIKRLEQMTEQKLLTPEEAALVSVTDLCRFFRTSLAKRMAQAEMQGTLKKEIRFLLGIPAAEYLQVYGGKIPQTEEDRLTWETAGEYVLLRGIVDAYFEENGAIVIVDYKTDRIQNWAEGAEELTNKYRRQLELYGRALQQLLEKSVSECDLYSFTLSKVIPLTS